jgi:hypothetical protein
MSRDTTYRVYLSSTLADLEEERKAVFAALASRACAVKQSYGASEKDLIATCRDDVGGCDVYVGIFGLRYGYQPPGDNPAGKSITELELDEAEAKGLQRFLFLKDEKAKGYSAADIDNPRAKIDALRQRIGSGQGAVPFLFADTESLKLEVTAKIAEFRSRSQPPPLLDNRKPHPAEIKFDVGLAIVPGTDDAWREKLAPLCGERRFRLIEVSPDDKAYLKKLDEGARHCRSLVFALTPASLGRFAGAPDLLATAATRLGRRFGRSALLLGGLAAAQLPAGVFDEVIESAAGEAAGEALERCYQGWRARSRPGGEQAIPIPCVILAPTAAEVASLKDDRQATLAAYTDPDELDARERQLDRLFAAIAAQNPKWPEGFYGPRREDWRPFGLGQGRKSIAEMLELAVARVNDESRRLGRERSLLSGRSAAIEIRPYSFDEWLDDRWGSRLLMEGLRDRGCLVLVDEIALLHPRLRGEGNLFLSGEQLAVLSANPCDPAHSALDKLLGDLSFLRVGSLRERYRDFQDPRCELAVNNVFRFERWLRLAVPEMVAILGQVEAEPALRGKMADFLAGKAP